MPLSKTDVRQVKTVKPAAISAVGWGFNDYIKGVLAIRRIFSLVDMITKPKFSNCPNVFKIGLFR